MTGLWSSGWSTGDVTLASEYRKGIGAIADTTLGGSAAKTTCAKTAYGSSAEAHAAMRVLLSTRLSKRKKPHRRQRAYHCPHCKAYHLTSEPERPA